MNSERWQRIEELFQKALDLQGPERLACIDALRIDAPEDAAELEKLLRAHQADDTFLGTNLFEEISDQTGQLIGAWKILHQIGTGGMSTVYLAERADGRFERKVAVKFLHGMVPGKEMHARLVTEQRILARLQHPNIAGLIDAGVTSDGRPYFILEYIDGVPVTDWCEEQNLTLNERLHIFEQVCKAVEYAHQHLVVHRDLKPSNILVSRDGIVKLLDFGIAKLMETDSDPDAPVTRTGSYMMTPEYASPEQIRGESITTACDVYALGLLLCEMLTGELPYDIRKKSPLEVGQVITRTEPAKPSSLISRRSTVLPDAEFAETSNGHTRSLSGNEKRFRHIRQKLKGDLDNIILFALRKDPQRRYGSVAQLRADLQRFRQNLPVSARPESLRYRAGKFIKRHRTGVALTAITGLLLAGAATVSILQSLEADRQRRIAQERYQDIRSLAGSFLFEFHDAIAPLPGSTAARELVIERALQYLDGLAGQTEQDRELWIELANAYNQIGNVQGNPTNPNLGRTTDAIQSYETALVWVRKVLAGNPDDELALRIEGNILTNLGDVYAQAGAMEAAEYANRMALDNYSQLFNRNPGNDYFQREYAIAIVKNGDLLGNPTFQNLGQTQAALDTYLQAYALFEGLLKTDEQTDAIIYRWLGLTLERIGTMHEHHGDLPLARQAYIESLDLREQYRVLNPGGLHAARDVAVAHEKVAGIHRRKGELLLARESMEKSMAIFRSLADADPDNEQARRSLAISYIHLGDLAYHPEQPSFDDRNTARQHFQESIRLLESAIEQDPENRQNARLMEITLNRLGNL